MAKMSSDSLKNNLTNVARVYLWEVLFTNPVGGGDGDVLELRCQTTTAPGRSVGAIHIPFKATAGIQFPGKVTYSHAWTCSFVEGTDGEVFAALHAWLQEISDSTTGIGGLDTEVKTNIFLNLLDQEGDIYRTIKIVGAFVQSIDDVPLPYGDDGEIKYNATFSFDRWEAVV